MQGQEPADAGERGDDPEHKSEGVGGHCILPGYCPINCPAGMFVPSMNKSLGRMCAGSHAA